MKKSTRKTQTKKITPAKGVKVNPALNKNASTGPGIFSNFEAAKF